MASQCSASGGHQCSRERWPLAAGTPNTLADLLCLRPHSAHLEGQTTQYLGSLLPTSIKGMVFWNQHPHIFLCLDPFLQAWYFPCIALLLWQSATVTGFGGRAGGFAAVGIFVSLRSKALGHQVHKYCLLWGPKSAFLHKQIGAT